MGPLGVEPRFQEPESYVRSITLRTQSHYLLYQIIGANKKLLRRINLIKKRVTFFLNCEKYIVILTVSMRNVGIRKSFKIRVSLIFLSKVGRQSSI